MAELREFLSRIVAATTATEEEMCKLENWMESQISKSLAEAATDEGYLSMKM